MSPLTQQGSGWSAVPAGSAHLSHEQTVLFQRMVQLTRSLGSEAPQNTGVWVTETAKMTAWTLVWSHLLTHSLIHSLYTCGLGTTSALVGPQKKGNGPHYEQHSGSDRHIPSTRDSNSESGQAG